MHIKTQALKTRQSPLQKAVSYGENALKLMGSVKAGYGFGKEAYGFGQSVYNAAQSIAPFAEGAMSLML